MCLAIPGQVLELVDHDNHIALVDVAGVRRKVNVSLLAWDEPAVAAGDGRAGAERPSVHPGDWVLIHVGFAISRIDEREAHATRALLEAMGREYEQELEELKVSVIE